DVGKRDEDAVHQITLPVVAPVEGQSDNDSGDRKKQKVERGLKQSSLHHARGASGKLVDRVRRKQVKDSPQHVEHRPNLGRQISKVHDTSALLKAARATHPNRFVGFVELNVAL